MSTSRVSMRGRRWLASIALMRAGKVRARRISSPLTKRIGGAVTARGRWRRPRAGPRSRARRGRAGRAAPRRCARRASGAGVRTEPGVSDRRTGAPTIRTLPARGCVDLDQRAAGDHLRVLDHLGDVVDGAHRDALREQQRLPLLVGPGEEDLLEPRDQGVAVPRPVRVGAIARIVGQLRAADRGAEHLPELLAADRQREVAASWCGRSGTAGAPCTRCPSAAGSSPSAK